MNEVIRGRLLAALGAKPRTDAQNALEVVIETLACEADQFGDSALAIAHAHRLVALMEFVQDFMTVTWTELEPKSAVAA